MDCNLVSFSNLHLFEQLRQDGSFSLDGGKVKLVGPAEELIVVFADFLNRIAPRIIFQQRGVFVLRGGGIEMMSATSGVSSSCKP